MLARTRGHHPRWLPAIAARARWAEALHGNAYERMTAVTALENLREEAEDVPGWSAVAERLAARDVSPAGQARIRALLEDSIDHAEAIFANMEQAVAVASHETPVPS